MSVWPVIQAAWSDTRNATALATSAAVPSRRERQVPLGGSDPALVEVAVRDEPVVHAVTDRPDANAVGADAEASLLGGEVADDGLDGGLRRRREHVLLGGAADGRGDERGDRAAALAQRGEGGRDDVEAAEHVGVELRAQAAARSTAFVNTMSMYGPAATTTASSAPSSATSAAGGALVRDVEAMGASRGRPAVDRPPRSSRPRRRCPDR